MAINTLITIKDALTAFVAGHGQLKAIKFEADDHRAPVITESDSFPLLFVAPIDVQVGRAMNAHTLRIYVYERINDDRSDVLENANDTSLILRDIRVWWNDYGVDDIEIKEDPTGIFVSDRELDNLVGYYADIRFEIPSHGRCSVPVDITPIDPVTCADADYQITDTDDNILYSGTIPSGGSLDQTIADSTATLKDTADNVLSTTQILAEGSEDIVAPDATYTVEYLNGTPIQSGNILSGGFELIVVPNPITCEDAVVNVNSVFFDNVASGGTLNIQVRKSSGSDLVGSKQGQYWRIGDSTAVLKTSGGATISTTSIKAEESEDITAPDATVENSDATYTDTVVSGGTLILPDETINIVDEDGNPLDTITFPVYTDPNIDITSYCPTVTPAPVGATLMKTGQTTSYRTGDDGDLEAGRATDFFTLASNNPFGNTNRFTDELGGSTYTNNIVIDWSTYDGATVLGYNRDINYWVGSNWDNSIDNALSYSIGTYTSGWYLANKKQHENLQNDSVIGAALNYAPFNYTTVSSLWTSTTNPDSTTSAYRWNLATKLLTSLGKTSSSNMRTLAVRNFTVTGTTLT
jgi:hypothetical protein